MDNIKRQTNIYVANGIGYIFLRSLGLSNQFSETFTNANVHTVIKLVSPCKAKRTHVFKNENYLLCIDTTVPKLYFV